MFTNTRTRFIEWGDCDPAGIVFNPRFFEWFDAATAGLFRRALGMTQAMMMQQYDMIGIPLVETHAVFHLPCAFGDEVTIESTVAEFRRSSFNVRHRLLRADGVLAVEGRETRVWVGRHPEKPGGMKAQPIPADVLAKFAVDPAGPG